jgi:hypothetical protein
MKYLNKNYLVCVGSCISQLVYTIVTDCDNPNVSISGEAFYNKDKSKAHELWYKFINKLFFWQKDHCKDAYYNDLYYAKKYIARDKL